MNVIVGLKNGASPQTVCYCFNWSKEKIAHEINRTGNTNVIEDIKEKMKSQGCSCEISNPSGKCCLKDVSEVIKNIKAQLNLT